MSTLLYGNLTTKREQAPPETSDTTSPPGVKTFVDGLAALVPAEVLLAHAAIIGFTTRTQTAADGTVTTTVTEVTTLRWTFAVLIVLSGVLYLVARRRRPEPLDAIRALIPPLAFVGWTMLQKTTAFDAVAPFLREPPRYAIAVIGAVVLGTLAVALAQKADQKG